MSKTLYPFSEKRLENSHPNLPHSQPQSSSPSHSPQDFLNWLKEKHRQELEKFQALISPQPQSIPYPNCLPQFGGRHKWTAFAVSLPQGKIYQCQFCFHEKLVSPNPQQFTYYFPPQTYYIR